MKEIWKDVEGYEGLYQASNLGRIKALRKERPFAHTIRVYPEVIMKPSTTKRGYYLVQFMKNGKARHYTLHRIIAKTFIPNPDNKLTVNHINANKLDNSVSNLEWCTYSENQLHACKLGLNKTMFKSEGNISNKKVINNSTGEIYDSIIASAKANNISPYRIYKMLSGETINTSNLSLL